MSLVRTERDGPMMPVITLNSPPLNLFDRAMTEELMAAFGRRSRTTRPAVSWSGPGEVVSGGVSVNEFKG